MKMIFLGPPGAGKGTIASKAKAMLNIPHISTGDIFRAAIKNETELGRRVKTIIDSGDLVPDELTVALVEERLKEKDASTGFILDGFPRTIPQAETLDKIADLDMVVNFEVDEEVIIKRLSGRRLCKNCGASFHVDFIPPKKENFCDNCGNELIIREDDKINSILNRLSVYRKSTEPLINYYTNNGKIKNIDASLAPEDVLKSFRSLVS